MPPRKRAAKAVSGVAKPTPIRSTARNTARDREFIADHAREFKVYEGQLVWSGRAEDIGSPFQLPPDDARCTHTVTRRDDEGKAILDADLQELKVRCPKWGMILGDGRTTLHVCVDHAGGLSAVKLAAQERAAAAADAIMGSMVDMALDKNLAPADRIRAGEKVLDRAGIRGGIEVSPDIPGWQKVISDYMAAGGDDAEES
jgi:hypothetical protein